MTKLNHICMEFSYDKIVFDYKDSILFHIMKMFNGEYILNQLNGPDEFHILDLDENDHLIIDGIDEI